MMLDVPWRKSCKWWLAVQLVSNEQFSPGVVKCFASEWARTPSRQRGSCTIKNSGRGFPSTWIFISNERGRSIFACWKMPQTYTQFACGENLAPSAARARASERTRLTCWIFNCISRVVKMCRVDRTREFCFPKTLLIWMPPGVYVSSRTCTHEQINTVGHSHRCRFSANLFSWRVLLLAFLRIFAMRKHKAFELIWFKWVKGKFSRSA